MTSPRFLSAVAVGTLLATAAVTTVACTKEEWTCPTNPVATGLAIAVGDRSNSPQPYWPAEIDNELDLIIQKIEDGVKGSGVTFVRADGDPTIGCVLTLNTNVASDTALEHNRNQFKKAVRAQVAAMAAQKKEADPLKALALAAAAAGPGGTAVLIDSGLQTVAPLDFRANSLLYTSSEYLVSQLANAKALPDLKDRKVVLVGIGYTAPPQVSLGLNRQAHLIQLWQKIVAASGANLVVTVVTPNTSAPDANLPEVSLVEVTATELPVGCNTEFVLSDDDVGFKPDSREFREESKARGVLAAYATWLIRHRNGRAKLTGTVAHHGSDSGNGGLALQRAERVRDLLIELGANRSQLTAVGEGWGPFPSKTAPPDKVSDPLNRRVVISLTC